MHPYTGYIDGLLNNNKFQPPKVGKHDDQAHSPIHPVKMLSENDCRDRNLWRIYDLVSRHFLACCSKDGIGEEF